MKLFSRDSDSAPSGWRQRLANVPTAVKWGALSAFAIGVVLLGWLGVQALDARSHLEQARGDAMRAKDALLSGKSDEAKRWAENVQFNARQSQSATRSLPWSAFAALPLLGSPLRTTQQISDVVVGLADTVLIPAAELGAGISPEKLVDGARIDLNVLRAEQPRLSELATASEQLNTRARNISEPWFLGPVRQARSQLQDQVSRVSQLLRNSAIAAELAPSMLGADGPRTYLMAFQTNAEARGTGGLAGGFGVLKFDKGIPRVDTLASNLQLAVARSTVDLPSDFDTVYGWTNPYTDVRNANLSAHFPYAAQLWKSMWENNTGESLDGVIAIDPIALSYLLGVLGPVRMPDGEMITQDNVVELTESTVYIRYPLATDQAPRKEYLQNVAKEVVKKATENVASPRKLLDALGKAAGEGRIAVWSASPRDQSLLEKTPLAHVIPEDEAPYAQVVVNNLAGNKMDYYLVREIEYDADGCDGEMRNSTVTVRLTNTATDAQLPDYYAGTEGLNPRIPLNVPKGTMVSSVRLIATKGSKLMSVTSNGEVTPAMTHSERGHPSFEVQIAIPPGQGGELTFRLSEPTSPGEPRVPVQPLVDHVEPEVSVPECPE